MATSTNRRYKRNVVPDMPDARDWLYEPSLRPVQYPYLFPNLTPTILDQGTEGACTGFALAAVVNQLMEQSGRNGTRVSARMLYHLARLHDEWPGEEDEGSSVRGAIIGWQNMGVCLESVWPSDGPDDDDQLTIARAKDARKQTLGAYYRLAPKIEHFHAALCENGALLVSADTHGGWDEPAPMKGSRFPVIRHLKQNKGGHAFAVVGYNESGFVIQNSWGRTWGKDGLAIWTYEDWVENFMDAWVVQLAYPTPEIFGKKPRSAFLAEHTAQTRSRRAPNRAEIAGHFVHIDDGDFHPTGRYWSTEFDTAQTARAVAASKEYKHLLIYCHGGLNSPEDSARRIAAMKETFKANGIYPYHIMYDVGLGEEIKDILIRKAIPFYERTGNVFHDLWDRATEFTARAKEKVVEAADQKIEELVRRPVTPIWDEMKRDAEVAFHASSAGTITLRLFLEAFANAAAEAGITRVHLAGHSTGAVVIGHLLDRIRRSRMPLDIASLSLFAPACTLDLFGSLYVPALRGKVTNLSIRKLNLYALTDRLERDDNVAQVYRKSLLYLVSNALERDTGKPILGMEAFHAQLPSLPRKVAFIYSDPSKKNAASRSKSHGGFDNDANTMNHLLETVLGRRPKTPFTQEVLTY